MSRIYLAGVGDAIPLEALPDPTVGDLPPLRVVFDADGDFDKTDFVSLGYTNWEAWAIGALGGDGGRVGDHTTLVWSAVRTRPVMSDADWALYKELQSIYGASLAPPYGPYSPPNEAGLFAYLEASFPAHDPYYRNVYSPPTLSALPNIYGGAGGGGGLHHTAGLLADLAATTPIVVGVPGAQGALGQNKVNGAWIPIYYIMTYNDGAPGDGDQGGIKWRTPANRRQELENYFLDFQYQYPEPRASFLPPVDGSDGSASTFGGTLARASGGKGGLKAQKWVGAVLTADGTGGEGGTGDQTAAGGGAAGSTGGTAPDGTWDGIIGDGGGGGRGGHVTPVPASVASSGGRGSYSFADTSVYGDRGIASGYIPGGGGGAKVGSSKYGGDAVSYQPGGAVILRLTVVEP